MARGAVRSAQSALRPAAGRILRAGVLMFALGVTQGCYTYTPIMGRADPGATLVLSLNDRGRSEMGEALGSSVAEVEGVLGSENDSVYVLNVSSVKYLNGQSNTWSGESLTVAKTYVSSLREREFSRGRTVVVAGGGVGAVLLFALSRSLLGSPPNVFEGPPPPPPDDQ
jgi:hypothetical protein